MYEISLMNLFPGDVVTSTGIERQRNIFSKNWRGNLFIFIIFKFLYYLYNDGIKIVHDDIYLYIIYV